MYSLPSSFVFLANFKQKLSMNEVLHVVDFSSSRGGCPKLDRRPEQMPHIGYWSWGTFDNQVRWGALDDNME